MIAAHPQVMTAALIFRRQPSTDRDQLLDALNTGKIFPIGLSDVLNTGKIFPIKLSEALNTKKNFPIELSDALNTGFFL